MKIEEINEVADFQPLTFKLTISSLEELIWLTARLNISEYAVSDACYDQDNYLGLLEGDEPESITDLWEYLDGKLKDNLSDDVCNECREQGCGNE